MRAAGSQALGIPAIALFPYTDPALRDEAGSEALNPENLVCRALHAIRQATPGIGLITDVALDPYTSHGHDGLMRAARSSMTRRSRCWPGRRSIRPRPGRHDRPLRHDGRTRRAIRAALDAEGFSHVQILAYAAKYASAFYGPFRDAVGTKATLVGDKRTYQMDPANTNEALREVAQDIDEGADIVMVKPGLPYLDII